MDDTLAASLAQQKARKVAETLVPTLVPEVVSALLPGALLKRLPSEVKASLPDALAAIYVAPRDGLDGKNGMDGKAGPIGPVGPSGFSHDDAVALEQAWMDLQVAVLTPRKRKVLRDNMGRITGLTEG